MLALRYGSTLKGKNLLPEVNLPVLKREAKRTEMLPLQVHSPEPLLQSERPKLYTILAFLSAIELILII